MRKRTQDMQNSPTSAASRAQKLKREGRHGAAKGAISSETVREGEHKATRGRAKPRTDRDQPRRETKRGEKEKIRNDPSMNREGPPDQITRIKMQKRKTNETGLKKN